MSRGVTRVCYIGDMSLDSECKGRRRLQAFECSQKKDNMEWICQSCYESLLDIWYCEGGLAVCPDCEGDCRK